MRIPSSINVNTLKAYEPHPTLVLKEKQTLESFNLEKWDIQIPKTLREICVEAIARNWTENPILDEIVLSIDRYLLLDILSTNLPLTLTIPHIHDDIYWKKCYTERWPRNLPHDVNPVEIFEIVHCHDVEKLNSVYSGSVSSVLENLSEKGSRRGSNATKSKSSSRSVSRRSKNDSKTRTWKEYYMEMHLKEYLEHLEPDQYDAEKMKELSDLCEPYIKVLRIDQLQCSENSHSRIPLNSILTGFQNLKELSLCFKQTYVGDKFSWNVLKTSSQDVKLLTKGLEKLRLRVFKIKNSDINCEKLIIVLKALLRHEIDVLDFSHCKISDKGALAISKFSLEVPVREIILTNNKIGFKGTEYLSHALLQTGCHINKLDLHLNPISSRGGEIIMKTLRTGAKILKSLNLSGCGFSENVPFGGMLRANDSLEVMDVSNNNIGEISGLQILEAMEYNATMKKLDLRMCKISSETEFAIYEAVNGNWKNRKVQEKYIEDVKESIEQNEELIKEFEQILNQ